MNEENKNEFFTEPEATEKKVESERDQGEKSKKTKKGWITVALVCAVIFVSLYALVNIRTVSEIFSSVTSVFTPIILGFAFAYMLNPILKLFEFKMFKKIKNKGVLRGLSLFMTYVVAVLIIVAIVFLMVPQLIDSVADFVKKFDSYMETTANVINTFIAKFLGKHEISTTVDKEEVIAFITNILTQSGNIFEAVGKYVLQYGTGLVVGIKNVVLAIFISIYVLSSKERLKAQTNKLVTAVMRPSGKRRFFKYLHLCNRTFSGFFIGKIVDSLIIGVITLVTLMIFNMPYAILVSTIVCITNVIPVFGPFIGAIPSFFIIFIVDPQKALIFLILILLIQQLDGNVIGPKILGDSTGLSSLGVIISIIIMGDYFGVIGMIVGVPIFAVAVSLISEFIERRLRKKNLPTNTAEYYENDSLVDPYGEHETVAHRIFRGVKDLFSKIKSKFSKKNKNKEDKKESE